LLLTVILLALLSDGFSQFNDVAPVPLNAANDQKPALECLVDEGFDKQNDDQHQVERVIVLLIKGDEHEREEIVDDLEEEQSVCDSVVMIFLPLVVVLVNDPVCDSFKNKFKELQANSVDQGQRLPVFPSHTYQSFSGTVRIRHIFSLIIVGKNIFKSPDNESGEAQHQCGENRINDNYRNLEAPGIEIVFNSLLDRSVCLPTVEVLVFEFWPSIIHQYILGRVHIPLIDHPILLTFPSLDEKDRPNCNDNTHQMVIGAVKCPG
jgi:hypothetical protein